MSRNRIDTNAILDIIDELSDDGESSDSSSNSNSSHSDDDDWEDLDEDQVIEIAAVTAESSNRNIGNSGQYDDEDCSQSSLVVEESNNNSLPTWENRPLYPPNSKKMKNPSAVWKLGGFFKVDGILQMEHVICGVCGKKTLYKNSPGNFKGHLEAHHKEEFENVNKCSGQKVQNQVKITEHFRTAGKTVKKYNSDHPKQRQFRRLLLAWIVDSIRPFSIVEDPKFRELIFLIDPQISIPSRRTVTRDIGKLYKEKYIATNEVFKDVEYFSGTTDAGTSLNNETFIDLNVHWIDSKTFEARKKIISVEKVNSKTADDYRMHSDKKLDDHGIKIKTSSMTTDNESTMRKCFEEAMRNGCFSHIESKASQKALDSSPRLKLLRKKLRKIAKKCNKSSKFKASVQKEQANRNLRILSIKQEVATRFTCTHIMFKSFLNDPNDSHDEGIDREKVDLNIESINESLKSLLKKKDFEKLRITSSDVDLMVKLMPTLDVLEEGIRVLGGESYCTGAVVLPFLVQLKKLLLLDDEDPVLVSKFKTALSKELTERCKLNLNFTVLAKASFFDKRFSKLAFLDMVEFPVGKELTKPQIISEIITELEEICEEVFEGSNTSSQEDYYKDVGHNSKRMKFLSGLCDGDNPDEVSSRSDPREEMARYQLEKDLKMNDNPLLWWRNNRNIYPLMSKLARKYLCIQATSTTAERSFSLMGNILTKKRMSLTPSHVNMLAYLSDCL